MQSHKSSQAANLPAVSRSGNSSPTSIQTLPPSSTATSLPELTAEILKQLPTPIGAKHKVQAYAARKIGTPIREASLPEIIADLTGCATDVLGVEVHKMPDGKSMKMLAGFVQDEYGHLTTASLGLAVTLLVKGELTEKDGKQIKPKDHYQNFSLAFLATWLESFDRYQKAAASEIRKALPAPEDARPKNEVLAFWMSELETRVAILAAYYDWQDNGGRMPENVIAGPMFQYIESKGWFTVSVEKKREIWAAAPAKLKTVVLGDKNVKRLAEMFKAVHDETDAGEDNRFALQTISRAECLLLCFRHWNTGIDPQEVMNLHLCATEIPTQGRITAKVMMGQEPDGTEAEILGSLYNYQGVGSPEQST